MPCSSARPVGIVAWVLVGLLAFSTAKAALELVSTSESAAPLNSAVPDHDAILRAEIAILTADVKEMQKEAAAKADFWRR